MLFEGLDTIARPSRDQESLTADPTIESSTTDSPKTRHVNHAATHSYRMTGLMRRVDDT